MISLILALALGQQCQIMPDGSQVCAPSRQSVVAQQSPRQQPAMMAWRKVAVRIEALQPPVQRGNITSQMAGLGSGVIVASDGDRALVLTNRHVVKDGNEFYVHRLGKKYSARVIKISTDPNADLAALEIASPIEAYQIPMASAEPNFVHSMVFDGQSGAYHTHSGAYMATSNEGDRYYGFASHHGDSGGPVGTPDGKLAGMVWATEYYGQEKSAIVPIGKIRRFLANETCLRFFRRKNTNTNTNVNVTVNTPEPVSPAPVPVEPGTVVEPATPTTPQVIVGQKGDKGDKGDRGDTGATGATGSSTPANFPDFVMQLVQPDGTVLPPKTYTVQTDPKTGKMAYGVKIDLNSIAPK